VKRLVILVGLGALLATGLSACDTSPPAATVNGVEISQATLNTDLQQLMASDQALCATQIQQGEAITVVGVGTQSDGTANAAGTRAAGILLQNLVLDQLEHQALARHGVTVTAADVSAAEQDYKEQLTQDASQTSVACAEAHPNLTSELPEAFLHHQAESLATQEKVEEAIGGVDVSEAALRRYYRAHLSNVNQVCLNLIVAPSQAVAKSVHDAVSSGKTFAQASQTKGLAQISPSGGQLACVYPSEVVSNFGTPLAAVIDNLPVGRIGPVLKWTDSQTGATYWLVVQMRQRNLVPLSQLATQIRQVLLSQGASKVTAALRTIASHSDVTVDPMYGTWHDLRGVQLPVPPPARFVPNPDANVAQSGSGLTNPGFRTPVPSGS
jgi:hypothetical protein